MKKLVIIGAGGQGRTTADIAKLNGYDEIYYLDDHDYSDELGTKYLGETKKAFELIYEYDFFVGIGSSKVREKLMTELPANYVNIIHPSAVIADSVKLGRGVLVMAGAVINNDTLIGDGVMITTCSSVDHNCCVGDYCLIGVGAHLCGTVNVGKSTWIGAGSTVSNNIDICGNCTLGAGAVVVKNIEVAGTYVGVPAKKVK